MLRLWGSQRARLLRGCMVFRCRCSVALDLRRLGVVSIPPSDTDIDLLIGIPSARIVKAMAFFVNDISEVSDGNRGLS